MPAVATKGTKVFQDGTYDGYLLPDGTRTGKGTCTYTSGPHKGQTFAGDWVNDKQTGQGRTVFKLASGSQSAFPSSGDVHEGEYQEGAITGPGVWYFADGRKYAGVFKGGKFHGEGTLCASETESAGTTQGPGQWDNGVYDAAEEHARREQLIAESERRAAELQANVDAVVTGSTSADVAAEPWEHEHSSAEIQTYVPLVYLSRRRLRVRRPCQQCGTAESSLVRA